VTGKAKKGMRSMEGNKPMEGKECDKAKMLCCLAGIGSSVVSAPPPTRKGTPATKKKKIIQS
jgi:hypothetical protein